MEISLENLYVDIGAQRVNSKTVIFNINHYTIKPCFKVMLLETILNDNV